MKQFDLFRNLKEKSEYISPMTANVLSKYLRRNNT